MPNIQRLKNLSGQAHIIGVSESNKLGKVPEKSPLAHHAEAAVNAIEDAGLQLSDVDALFVFVFTERRLGHRIAFFS